MMVGYLTATGLTKINAQSRNAQSRIDAALAADWMSLTGNDTNVLANVAEEDREDIHASLRGDEKAFERIVKRFQPLVTSQMWRFTRDPVVLEELVQDVFVEVYNSLKNFKGKAPFLHWVRRIATRVGYRYWKEKSKRDSRHVDLDAISQMAGVQPQETAPSEAAEYLYKILAALAPEDRLVLTLHYMEGYNTEEIAEQVGWSRTYVRVRMYRARNYLKKRLELAGFGGYDEQSAEAI